MSLCSEDMYAQDSIDLLTNCGIQFKRHDEYGLDVSQFAELLMTSGVVLTEDVRWISFHRYASLLHCSHLNAEVLNKVSSYVRCIKC